MDKELCLLMMTMHLQENTHWEHQKFRFNKSVFYGFLNSMGKQGGKINSQEY